MFGFYNINKPVGPTSHDMVAALRRRLPRRTRVGHAGTLDPFADGVLVVCVGPATRLAEYVQTRPKTYRATVRLGATSDTDDPTGTVTPTAAAEPPTTEQVHQVLARFRGTVRQVPPAHSAVHVNGQRAYRLARRGQPVDLPERTVQVHGLELLTRREWELDIEVRCSTGTYIRSLARDIGEALGVGGYCQSLTRSAVGDFTLDRAKNPEQIDLEADVLPARLAVEHLPQFTLGPDALAAVCQGKQVTLDADAPAGPCALLDGRGQLAALGEVPTPGRSVRPKKVFRVS